MEIKVVTANHGDFIALTEQLDDNLNVLGAHQPKEERQRYASYNGLSTASKVYIMYDDNLPIACAACKPHSSETAEVKRVFVNPDFRGKGLAKKLIEKLEEAAKNDGFNSMILETGKHNTGAISLYQKMNYRQIDNFPPYVDMDDSVCMKKTLLIK